MAFNFRIKAVDELRSALNTSLHGPAEVVKAAKESVAKVEKKTESFTSQLTRQEYEARVAAACRSTWWTLAVMVVAIGWMFSGHIGASFYAVGSLVLASVFHVTWSYRVACARMQLADWPNRQKVQLPTLAEFLSEASAEPTLLLPGLLRDNSQNNKRR